jgi:hypothetical protein
MARLVSVRACVPGHLSCHDGGRQRVVAADSGVARIRSYGGPLLKFCLTRIGGVQVYKLCETQLR